MNGFSLINTKPLKNKSSLEVKNRRFYYMIIKLNDNKHGNIKLFLGDNYTLLKIYVGCA